MSKHTPGPWKARKQEGLRAVLIESLDEALKDQSAIASVWTGGIYENLGPSNAQLIAAAPELYEALCQCSDYFHDFTEQDYNEVRLANHCRLALAKARGEK